jgi:hypothetical protein
LVVTDPGIGSATLIAAFDYKSGTPTMTPGTPVLGANKIDIALPDLNPSTTGPSSFKIQFEGGVDGVALKIYTLGMQCIGSYTATGNLDSRWQTVPMDRSAYQGLSAGTYYFVVTGIRGGVQSKPFIGKFVIIR